MNTKLILLILSLILIVGGAFWYEYGAPWWKRRREYKRKRADFLRRLSKFQQSAEWLRAHPVGAPRPVEERPRKRRMPLWGRRRLKFR